MGDSGQPCRVLLDIEKAFDRWPLTRTFAVGEEYKASIKFSMRPLSPRAISVFDIKSQATLSNAFSASRERKKPAWWLVVSQ